MLDDKQIEQLAIKGGIICQIVCYVILYFELNQLLSFVTELSYHQKNSFKVVHGVHTRDALT